MRGCKSNSGIFVNDRGSNPPGTDYSYVQSGKLTIPPWKWGGWRAKGGLSPHLQILWAKWVGWDLQNTRLMPQLRSSILHQRTAAKTRSPAPRILISQEMPFWQHWAAISLSRSAWGAKHRSQPCCTVRSGSSTASWHSTTTADELPTKTDHDPEGSTAPYI